MRRFIWAVLICFIANIGMGVTALIYANRVAQQAEDNARMALHESEQAWCEILDDIYQGQQEEPPQGESGREFASRIADLRTKFKCV